MVVAEQIALAAAEALGVRAVALRSVALCAGLRHHLLLAAFAALHSAAYRVD